MGIALLTFADLLSPLQAFASRWIAPRRRRRAGSADLRYVAIRPACSARAAGDKASGSARAARPLRVIRVVDPRANGVSGGASRMVISGRMADVCAELDRLAALEAHGLAPAAAAMH